MSILQLLTLSEMALKVVKSNFPWHNWGLQLTSIVEARSIVNLDTHLPIKEVYIYSSVCTVQREELSLEVYLSVLKGKKRKEHVKCCRCMRRWRFSPNNVTKKVGEIANKRRENKNKKNILNEFFFKQNWKKKREFERNSL